MFAGLMTTLASNPLDVVRTRVHILYHLYILYCLYTLSLSILFFLSLPDTSVQIFNESSKPKHERIYTNPIKSLFTIGYAGKSLFLLSCLSFIISFVFFCLFFVFSSLVLSCFCFNFSYTLFCSFHSFFFSIYHLINY